MLLTDKPSNTLTGIIHADPYGFLALLGCNVSRHVESVFLLEHLMAAPTSGQTVQYYPKRGGQLAVLNAISAITPLSASIVGLRPLNKVNLFVTDSTSGRSFLARNIPYFDSEYATAPYTNIIPGDGGYCVDPNDPPAFPPPQTVPYQPGGWTITPDSPNPPANPADSEQPYIPVKIMEDDTTPPESGS